MKKFFRRLKAAWFAFFLIDAEILIDGYSEKGAVSGKCDYSRRLIKCENLADQCISRSVLIIKFETDSDHYHLCESCGDDLIRTQLPNDTFY